MSTTDQMHDLAVAEHEHDHDHELNLVLDFEEAEALRTWLLKSVADGASALDDPLVNGVLGRLGRAVDTIRATIGVRRELEQAGLAVAHLSDDQVRDLGHRISEATLPGVRT